MSATPFHSKVDDRAAASTLIFGGTFDPPHVAHIELAQMAARELGCSRLVFIPAAINPLKVGQGLPPTPAIHRLAMLRLATEGIPEAAISTIELDRAGPSYTIDTLRAHASGALTVGWASPTARGKGASPRQTSQSTAPVGSATGSMSVPIEDISPPIASVGDAHPTHLLIGADQALDFHRWKDWREILQRATPAVMLREPWTRESFVSALRERYDLSEAQTWESRILRTLPIIEISATEIRRRLISGRPLTGLVHPRVEAYIRGYGLYVGGGEGHGE